MDYTTPLQAIGAEALSHLERVNTVRERALTETRQIVRLSANSIRASHRHDFAEAADLLEQAGEKQGRLVEELGEFPSLAWSGYVQDALKEFTEATLVFAVIADQPLPMPTELGVEPAVYLNALGETAGELRRYALDSIRRGEIERAERMLAIMDEIYGLLVTVDYPDAITNGLRRTTDMVRGVLERTRGDLTLTLQQQALAGSLQRLEGKFDRGRLER
jgi:translin